MDHSATPFLRRSAAGFVLPSFEETLLVDMAGFIVSLSYLGRDGEAHSIISLAELGNRPKPRNGRE